MNTVADQRSGLLRAVGVITLIADQSPQSIGLSTITRRLEIPKTVAHRILKEFSAAGFLIFDNATKEYRLGPGALTLGLAALRTLNLPRIARPHLQRMVARTGETATLSVRTGWTRVYVDQVLSPHEIRMAIPLGSSHPLYAGSSSKAILAHIEAEEVERYLAEHMLEAVTPATITDVALLRRELALVRDTGYAVSRGERQYGAGSVAAPIHGASGEVDGSISLCGPLDRFGDGMLAQYAALVVEIASLISAELGHRPAMIGDVR